MTKIGTYALKSGSMVEVTLKRDDFWVAKLSEDELSVFKYTTGVQAVSKNLFYFATSVASIPESNFILTTEDDLINFYVFDGVNQITLLFSQMTGDVLYSLDFSPVNSKGFYGGFEKRALFEITITSGTSLCHPLCSGGCSKGFSPSACTSCAAGSALTSGMCKQTTPTVPDKSQGDFAATSWSAENTDPFGSDSVAQEESQGFFDKVKSFLQKHWKWIAIGVGAIVVLWVLKCMICGGEKDKKGVNAVTPARQASARPQPPQPMNKAGQQIMRGPQNGNMNYQQP